MIIKAAILRNGKVYTGRRHPDIIYEMRLNGLSWNQTEIEGFITDTGEFLNRKDARKHFIDSGQISVSGDLREDALYSEDLY